MQKEGKVLSKHDYSVDVIIPTYHSDDKLDKLIKMLYRQSIQPNEIIILQTRDFKGQEQPLPAISDINISVVPIDKNSFDHGGTRKFGASLSKADIIMFMTQDAIPADEFLIEQMLQPYQDDKVAATYARQLPDEKAGTLEGFTREFNYPKKSRVKSKSDLKELGIKTFFCSDVCASYRNQVYQQLGGFVEKTIFNEDMIMAAAMIRSDYKVVYKAEAKVYHSHHYTYWEQLTRNFDLGVSHRQYPEVFMGMKSESEGLRLVKDSIRFLYHERKLYLVFDLIISSGFKYLGYQLGKRYQLIPKGIVIHLSMNRFYWKNRN